MELQPEKCTHAARAAWAAAWVGLIGACVVGVGISFGYSRLWIIPGLLWAGGVLAVARGRSGEWLGGLTTGRCVLLLLIATLAGRLAAVLLLQFTPAADFEVYHEAGMRMASEWTLGGPRQYRCFFPPGQIFSLGVLYHVFGPHVVAGQLLNVVYAAATVLGVWSLGRDLFGSRAGRTAALVYAATPSAIFGCMLLGAEAPGAAWLTLGLAAYVGLVLRGRAPAWGAAITGLCFGVGALVRPQILLVALVAAAHLLWTRRRQWKAATMTALLLLTVAAAAIAPWTYRNYRVTGGFLLLSSNAGGNLWNANNDLTDGGYTEEIWEHLFTHSPDDLTLNRSGLQGGLEWIRAHPGGFMHLACRKAVMFWAHDGDIPWWATSRCGYGQGSSLSLAAIGASNGFYAALMLAVTWLLWRRRRWLQAHRTWLLLPLVLACYTGIHMVFESQCKYRYVLGPLLAVLAGLWAMRAPVLEGRTSGGYDRPAATEDR